MDIDVERVTELAGEVATHMAGATTMAMVHIGDELGLYEAMAGAGPMTAGALAEATGCNPRLVTEWLRQQAAVELVEIHVQQDEGATFELTDEAAAVLAWEVSPAFLAGGIGMFRAMFADMDDILEAFRGDGGLGLGRPSPLPVLLHRPVLPAPV